MKGKKKNNNGDGSVRKLTDGSWECVIQCLLLLQKQQHLHDL